MIILLYYYYPHFTEEHIEQRKNLGHIANKWVEGYKMSLFSFREFED